MKKELSQDSPTMNRHSNTLPTKLKPNGTVKKISPKRKKSKANVNRTVITSSLSYQEDSNGEAKNSTKEQEPKVRWSDRVAGNVCGLGVIRGYCLCGWIPLAWSIINIH